jgi:hypothetical protein
MSLSIAVLDATSVDIVKCEHLAESLLSIAVITATRSEVIRILEGPKESIPPGDIPIIEVVDI